jgi:hypothetical protein
MAHGIPAKLDRYFVSTLIALFALASGRARSRVAIECFENLIAGTHRRLGRRRIGLQGKQI